MKKEYEAPEIYLQEFELENTALCYFGVPEVSGGVEV